MQRNALKFRYGVLLADTGVIVLSFVVACILRDGSAHTPLRLWSTLGSFPILLSSVVAWMAVSHHMRLNGLRRGWSWSKICSELAVGVAIVMVLVAATAYVAHDFVPRLLLLYFAGLLLLGLLGVRAVLRPEAAIRWRRTNRRVVIVGAGRVAQEVACKLERHREMLCDVVGFLCPSSAHPNGFARPGQEVTVPPLEAIELLKQKQATDIVVAFSGEPMPDGLLELVASCRDAGVRVSVIPYVYELYTSRASLLDLDGLPLVVLDDTAASGPALAAKRLFDVLIASIAAPFCLGIFVPAIVYLHFLRGKALRNEIRCGRFGRPFRMYRLCIDRNGSESSRFERILDYLSITELPQLWNVLKGDMSIVGPRPESPGRVRQYSDWQRQRLIVPPGMTGLAQVHGLRDHHSSEEKANFDLQYIASWNLLYDTVLVVQTLWTLASRVFACKRVTSEPRPQAFNRKAGLSSC